MAALFLLIPALVGSVLAAAPERVTGGYYGDFVTHPGAYAGATWTLAEAGAVRALGGFEAGAYHHRRNHTGAFARGTFGLRATSGGGWFVEPRFVGGYLHTWVDAETYWMVDEATGDVYADTPGGSPNVVYGMGLGAGWERRDGPAVLLRAESLGRAPYNDYTLSQFALLVGVEWTLGGGAR